MFLNKIHPLMATVAIFFTGALITGCADTVPEDSVPEIKPMVSVERPEDAMDAEIISEKYVFHNVSTGADSEFTDGAAIKVEPGLYNISYEAQLLTPEGATTTLRASQTSVNITSENVSIILKGYSNIETDDLIIAEIFFAGTLHTSGNKYNGDDYIKLYNNTDHVIYADGITIFESKFLTTAKYEHSPNIMDRAMNVDALYTIPGSGKDVPVQPGEYLLVCDTGIDHRTANPNSFDLSGADFEWYDVSTKPSSLDIDGPTVPNLDKWYCYTLSYWLLHDRGFKAYGIARIPVDRDTYLTDYKYHYDYTLVTVAGSFEMSADAYELPNNWIVDVVNCSVQSEYAWNLCAPQLDCGWTSCGTMDKDKSRYFHSVRRKVLRFEEDGRMILKDTNNSTEDFNSGVIASEIELQGTAMDVDGTRCTSLTYDGVMPREGSSTTKSRR